LADANGSAPDVILIAGIRSFDGSRGPHARAHSRDGERGAATDRFLVKMPMPNAFKRGDLVEWNSEAGRVRGVIVKRLVSNILVKGYVHHASKAEPQYVIKSVKTDHVVIQKGSALRHVRAKKR
jgi:hypothetical protein